MKETQFISDRHLRDKNVGRFEVLEKVKDCTEIFSISMVLVLNREVSRLLYNTLRKASGIRLLRCLVLSAKRMDSHIQIFLSRLPCQGSYIFLTLYNVETCLILSKSKKVVYNKFKGV